MIKKHLGLDGIDLVIHVGITLALLVLVASASRGGGDVAGVMGGVVALSLGVLAWRRGRARKNLASTDGPTTGEVVLDRMVELEGRLADLEQAQARLLELEERLDFTERLLVRQRESEAARLAPGERV